MSQFPVELAQIFKHHIFVSFKFRPHPSSQAEKLYIYDQLKKIGGTIEYIRFSRGIKDLIQGDICNVLINPIKAYQNSDIRSFIPGYRSNENIDPKSISRSKEDILTRLESLRGMPRLDVYKFGIESGKFKEYKAPVLNIGNIEYDSSKITKATKEFPFFMSGTMMPNTDYNLAFSINTEIVTNPEITISEEQSVRQETSQSVDAKRVESYVLQQLLENENFFKHSRTSFEFSKMTLGFNGFAKRNKSLNNNHGENRSFNIDKSSVAKKRNKSTETQMTHPADKQSETSSLELSKAEEKHGFQSLSAEDESAERLEYRSLTLDENGERKNEL